MVSQLLNPKNDIVFKKIFGTEKNKDILIYFLNSILGYEGSDRIREVSFLKTGQEPELLSSKLTIVDVLCEDEKGSQYIVEMQVAKEKGFEKRVQFYAARAYSQQATTGSRYHHLKRVVIISITDFILFPEKKDFLSHHAILDLKTLEHNLKDFHYSFLELPKFKKKADELETIIDKWAYFFQNSEQLSTQELSEISKNDAVIDRAYFELVRTNWNINELRTYETFEKEMLDYKATLEQKFDEGREEGREEGLQEGREEGREEGLQEGKAQATMAFMHNLLKEGSDVETIARLTGISIEKVEEEKKKMTLS